MADETLDVAVVGGGVSGVYTAWRLLTANRKRRITVFEASDHIGGRLLSVTPPHINNMTAELGGMRILPAVQPLITNLIKELNKGASPSEKIDTYDFPVDKPENLAYLRGTYLRLQDFTTNPEEVPYHVTFQEYGLSPGALMVNAIEQIVPGITNSKLNEAQRREMCQKATFSGVPLYKQGFWNVLMRVMSGEGYHLGLDAGGYESTLSNWNAADAIPWYLSDFGVDPKYKGFKKGFQQVPLTVAKRFEAEKGKIVLNKPLKGFTWDKKSKLFDLLFKDGSTVQAKALILAMPRRSLELVAPGTPLLETISPLIQSVTPRPLFKLFTTYMSPWWRTAGATIGGQYVPLQEGRTVTDLPVRQTYYWVKDDGKPVTQGRAMLMASYDDGLNIGFWDGYRPKRGAGWRAGVSSLEQPESFIGEADIENEGYTAWRNYPAPKRMVKEVERQLATVHGLAFIPHVVDACFRDWGDDPFGGGWNSWNIGVESWQVKKKIIKPYDDKELDLPLYICGEAYSDAQGWVEGALQTADAVLAKFGLKALGTTNNGNKKSAAKA
jgi:monoamine oxidase